MAQTRMADPGVQRRMLRLIFIDNISFNISFLFILLLYIYKQTMKRLHAIWFYKIVVIHVGFGAIYNLSDNAFRSNGFPRLFSETAFEYLHHPSRSDTFHVHVNARVRA